MQKTQILYNARCPICRAEIAHYSAIAAERDLPLAFTDLHDADLADWHLTSDQAKRRLHARLPGGEARSGLDAFAAIWVHLPRMGWMARVIRWPILGTVARLAYDRIAAPALYRLHLRRERLGKARPAP